jgi:hypothetical protein
MLIKYFCCTQFPGDFNFRDFHVMQIDNLFAADTHKVVVRAVVAVKPRGLVEHIDLEDNPLCREALQVHVYGVEGQAGMLVPQRAIHCISTGMIFAHGKVLQDSYALGSRLQAAASYLLRQVSFRYIHGVGARNPRPGGASFIG